jgi:hypothetical protein
MMSKGVWGVVMFVVGVVKALDTFNYIWGTQTFGIHYKFTVDNGLVETAKVIQGLGSNFIKLNVGPGMQGQYNMSSQAAYGSLAVQAQQNSDLATVFNMPFAYYVMWTYTFTNPKWQDGMSQTELDAEYKEIYDYTKYLLTTFNNTGKSFYFGHWEGDWYILGTYDRTQDPTPTALNGMIQWLNIRSKAVDQCKQDHPHTNVFVWNYISVNLVQKAIAGGVTLTNNVVPYVNVDYVSYSSYDSLDQSKVDTLLPQALDYIKSKIPAKANVPGSRVMIGEFGFPATVVGAANQNAYAVHTVKVAVNWGVDFCVYWEVYGNEYNATTDAYRGFWLIDDHDVKQPVYYSMLDYHTKSKAWVQSYKNANGGATPSRAAYQSYVVGTLLGSLSSSPPSSTGGTSTSSCTNQLYGQCGGSGWTGATCCPSGSACQSQNQYYSQCVAVAQE